jgi:Cu/Ag efflux protein CusF
MDSVDSFKKHNVVEKDYAGLLYERLLTRIIQKYLDSLILGKKIIKDVYGDDDTIESKFEDDMTEMEQCFSQFLQKDTLQEVMFPLMNLKFYIKDITKCKDDLDKFIFALNELLREYPQCWDVALAIVNQTSFLGGEMKKKMKDCIEASFLKEVQSTTEPIAKKTAFSKYTVTYSIAAKREQERKFRAVNQQITSTVTPIKKVEPVTPTVKKEVPKETPKKDADIGSLDDFLGEAIEI